MISCYLYPRKVLKAYLVFCYTEDLKCMHLFEILGLDQIFPRYSNIIIFHRLMIKQLMYLKNFYQLKDIFQMQKSTYEGINLRMSILCKLLPLRVRGCDVPLRTLWLPSIVAMLWDFSTYPWPYFKLIECQSLYD